MKSFMRNNWKWAFVLILIILLGFIWRSRAADQKLTADISTAKVVRGDFVKKLTSSGKTKADKSVDLKFQSSGKLAWVGVKEGDTVQAYQAIAGLDAREVQKNLEKALRDYSSERNDFEQTWRVTYDGKKPNDAFNDTVKRILEKNQWDLEKAVLDVELKHLAVQFATLVTPIAGIVTHIDTPIPGVNITPATSVFSVADVSKMIFEANVDETDIGQLSVGHPAQITLDAFPQASYSGTISYISYISIQSGGGATVFPVKIAFTDPQNLRIGLNGDIAIETQRQTNVLMIPTEALREEKGTLYVYRKQDGKFEKVTVTTGEKNEDDVIIASGLSQGDVVVTKGFTSIPK